MSIVYVEIIICEKQEIFKIALIITQVKELIVWYYIPIICTKKITHARKKRCWI